ncbi:hypothetical protein B0T22DRAFT_483915 [Podospora appendiculata]|uniref:BZIP domain-containing protein n=1 Tax=Podospora appendiculata TaxID=314037 RepID=A0AAE0X3N9_9PEZI|nr:hypothetical protein B0T22DRAFT_483915 [Podospora appendiculata]
MPRKNKTPASSVVNRENQRRSRARHRDFVDDLQRRVLEYESRGVQATLEMQRVARAVAAENRKLRALLATRFSPAEIDAACLASSTAPESPGFGDHARDWESASISTRQSSRSASQSQALLPRPALPPVPDLQHSPLSSLQPYSPPSPHVPAVQHNINGDDLHPDNAASTTCAYSNETGTDINHISASHMHLPPIDPACYCPPELQTHQKQQLPDSSAVMPCQEAATILSQLRGQPDSTLAREALGCPGMTDCLVRNTDVFRLMDEMTN